MQLPFQRLKKVCYFKSFLFCKTKVCEWLSKSLSLYFKGFLIPKIFQALIFDKQLLKTNLRALKILGIFKPLK